jgi:DNA-binding MarR family transcriptional regulator
MTLRTIYSLAECQYGKYFLTKSYSIELLLYLLENRQADGIEDLLLNLRSSTPKLPAFLAYIALLEAKGCITKIENVAKRSKRIIMLTRECEEIIRRHFAT